MHSSENNSKGNNIIYIIYIHLCRMICTILAQRDPDNIVEYFSAKICLQAVRQNVQVIF